MWIIAPSTSCRSAQAVQGSTSDLKSQSETLEQSVWWRGKPSPSRTWERRLKAEPFVRRLSGRMSPPSEADRGVEQWICSLRAIRVNPSASLEAARARQTSGTSGPTSEGTSSRYGQHGFFWRMSEGTYLWDGIWFDQNSSASDMRSNTDSSPPTMSDTPTDENASSRWPTPAARDWKGTNGPDHLDKEVGRMHLDQLPNFVEFMWSTPTMDSVSDREAKYAQGGLPLAMQANEWPTPTAALGTGGQTSRSGDRKGEKLLAGMAKEWPTPKASTGGANSNRENRDKTGGPDLKEIAQSWQTPRMMDSQGSAYQRDHGEKGKERETLSGQSRSHHPALKSSTDGETSSTDTRTLNPRFVEWLMGWPIGWTVFGCSEMELCHYRLRMHFELSTLVSEEESKSDTQLDLFS